MIQYSSAGYSCGLTRGEPGLALALRLFLRALWRHHTPRADGRARVACDPGTPGQVVPCFVGGGSSTSTPRRAHSPIDILRERAKTLPGPATFELGSLASPGEFLLCAVDRAGLVSVAFGGPRVALWYQWVIPAISQSLGGGL